MNNNKQALNSLRSVLQKAEDNGYLQQLWTLIEAMRGPDAKREDGKAVLKDNYITPVRKCVLTRSMAKTLGVSDADNFGEKPLDKVILIDNFHDIRNHARRHAILAEKIINA